MLLVLMTHRYARPTTHCHHHLPQQQHTQPPPLQSGLALVLTLMTHTRTHCHHHSLTTTASPTPSSPPSPHHHNNNAQCPLSLCSLVWLWWSANKSSPRTFYKVRTTQTLYLLVFLLLLSYNAQPVVIIVLSLPASSTPGTTCIDNRTRALVVVSRTCVCIVIIVITITAVLWSVYSRYQFSQRVCGRCCFTSPTTRT